MEKDRPPPYSGPPPVGFVQPPPQAPIHMNPVQPQVIIHSAQNFGPTSQVVVCPSCHAQVSSSIVTEANTKTHLLALLLCFCGCPCCFCIPYCTDSCQSQNHYCPNCKSYLGTFEN